MEARKRQRETFVLFERVKTKHEQTSALSVPLTLFHLSPDVTPHGLMPRDPKDPPKHPGETHQTPGEEHTALIATLMAIGNIFTLTTSLPHLLLAVFL